MNSILTIEQYPLWFIALCFGLGLLYAFVLYFRDTIFKEASPTQRLWLWPLSLVRFLTVSAIALLLLAPFIKTQFIDEIKPQILVLQDESESMQNGFKDLDKAVYENNMNELVSSLQQNYEVKTYSFGEKLQDSLQFGFDQKITNIAEPLEQIYDTYDNQNVGAIILATDGIYNKGNNPIYSNTRLDVPIYSIALGDTTPKRDLLIEKVLHNKIAYLGDKFTIRVDLAARNCKGESTVINVYKGEGTGNKVASKTIHIGKEDFIHSEDIILNANEAGVQQYSIRASKVKEELTEQNNRQDIFIEVLDSRQKILLLAASPHPDISALKQAMEGNRNYEISSHTLDDLKGLPRGYDMAVLHGIPSKRNNAEAIIQELKKNNTTILFIVSSQTSVPDFNRAQDIVKIEGSGGAFNDVKAERANGNFNLFTFEESIINALAELPPLVAPFGDYSAAPTTQVLLKQRIGNVSTNHPMMVLKQATGYKMAVLTGEGFWRWRLYDYLKDGAHQATNELISKTMQYLSVKNDKRKFRVNLPKSLFNENESISFDAELYNDSYELVNDPEVNMVIVNSRGKEFPFAYSKTATAYTLDAGFFPVGKYSYRARTMYNNTEYTASGNFSVAPIQLETMQTTANHKLIFALSEQSGGELVYPDSISTIANKIQTRPEVKPWQYSSYKTNPVINLKWLFFCLLGALSLEWFVRKFIGGY